ncbi:DUF455 family protein [Dechloromonas sp. ZY10]|uniref:DUF455 family protein n=1 Tax=Dechloromonas aquae TaxID=2664436 RepID=UPI003529550E
MESLYAAAAAALATPEIGQKLALTVKLHADWQAGRLDWQGAAAAHPGCGCPERPELVPPKQLLQRNARSPEGRARLLHAIVHIEFTAIKFGFNECKDKFFTFAV